MRASEDFLPSHILEPILEDLRAASNRLDYDATRDILNQVVKEYSPNSKIDDLIWAQKAGMKSVAHSHTVVDFPSRES